MLNPLLLWFLPLALLVMLSISLASPRHVRRLALVVFCGSIVLLAATFVIGIEIKGARRWISVPGLSSLQPSEFVKPSLAVISAWLLAQSRTTRTAVRKVRPSLKLNRGSMPRPMAQAARATAPSCNRSASSQLAGWARAAAPHWRLAADRSWPVDERPSVLAR